jgi:hypothetical protein
MKNNFYIILLYSLISVSMLCFKESTRSTLAVQSINHRIINVFSPAEKRGSPPYDAIIGKDGLPHFRVFFWVPKNATNLIPYADPGINTKVLTHGSVENWYVVRTNTYKKDEQLVFIYVPKTFVLFYGKGFENVIHLSYK